METLNEQYRHMLYLLIDKGMITKPRNIECRELLFKYFEINPNDNIITIKDFETNIEYAKEELKWYYAATNKINFSPIINKTWKKFSDDGKKVNSAYGVRIFGTHNIININQWEWCKQKLKEDPESRQAIINLNSWFDKEKPTKDFICTIYMHFFIRQNKLHLIVNLRSQDIYFGTRNDIYCFTEMQKRMAKELNLKLGTYYHICNSLHIYSNQYHKLVKLFNIKL